MEINKTFFDLFDNFKFFIHLFINFIFIFDFKMLTNNFDMIITFFIFKNIILRSFFYNQCHIWNKLTNFFRSLFFKNWLKLLNSIIFFHFNLRLKTLIYWADLLWFFFFLFSFLNFNTLQNRLSDKISIFILRLVENRSFGSF